MRPHLILICFLLIISTGLTQSPRPAAGTAGEKAELTSITNRVFSGDYSALYDAAKMPALVSVPYLRFWTGFGRTPQQFDTASNALRQVQGYADYLQQDMAAMSAEGRVPGNDFELLGIIGTPEAAAVAAPYLFDFTTIEPQRGDLTGESNLVAAVYTLTKMKLSGAPSPLPLGPHKNSRDLIAWQKWAIAKGFVPKEWSSRVGPPAWMVQFEQAQIASGMFPSPASEGHPGAPSSPSAAPSVSGSAQIQNNTPQPVTPAVESKASGQTSVIFIAAILALLIIGGVIVLKKRS